MDSRIARSPEEITDLLAALADAGIVLPEDVKEACVGAANDTYFVQLGVWFTPTTLAFVELSFQGRLVPQALETRLRDVGFFHASNNYWRYA